MSEKIKDYIFKIWIGLSTLTVFLVTIYIFGYISRHGLSSINKEFIFAGPKGIPLGTEGGIFPAIVGSLYLMLIACFTELKIKMN